MSLVDIRIRWLAIVAIALLTGLVAPTHAQEAAPEQEFIAILQSDGPEADKALACKKLAVVGSDAAVPELAKLLSNEHLASWARIALEAIPGAAAEEALRSATSSLDGLLLVGVVNSMGVRRDAGSVEVLSALMDHQDALVASCAAVALGRIGNEAATAKVRDSLASARPEVRSAVAEACVLCAEQQLAAGNATAAIEIYDQVRAAEVPKQRVLEATRGAILARGDEGIPLLVEQLRSGDKSVYYIALSTAREIPGNRVDAALAGELPTMAPFRAPALIATMADRPDTVVLTAIQDAAASGPDPVRAAAITALGRVGNSSCLDLLLEIAGSTNQDLAPTAKQALEVLPGESIDQEIVNRVGNADGGVYLALIELIGRRRIEAIDPLLKALKNSDQAVRTASLTSLGRTIPFDQLSILIKQSTTPENASDAEAAQAALKTAAVRMPDREACAAQIAAALNGSSVPTQVALLEILAAVAGENALEALRTSALKGDVQLRDASTRLLGGWLTTDSAPILLELSTTGPADRFRVRALRGYLRVARQFVKDDVERLKMLRNALAAAPQPAEQKLVLEVLEQYANVDGLKLAIELQQVPAIKSDAQRSVLVIAQKTADHNDEVLALVRTAGLPMYKIEIIKAEYGAGGSQKDVTETLKKLVTNLPVLVLPGTYNDSFGGDPAPDMTKKLRVQYTIDGKPGDTSFNENRLIVLVPPKPQ